MGNGVTAILLAGVIACLAMDVWQQILKRMSGIPATNWAIVGRWFVLTLRRGTIVSPDY